MVAPLFSGTWCAQLWDDWVGQSTQEDYHVKISLCVTLPQLFLELTVHLDFINLSLGAQFFCRAPQNPYPEWQRAKAPLVYVHKKISRVASDRGDQRSVWVDFPKTALNPYGPYKLTVRGFFKECSALTEKRVHGQARLLLIRIKCCTLTVLHVASAQLGRNQGWDTQQRQWRSWVSNLR